VRKNHTTSVKRAACFMFALLLLAAREDSVVCSYPGPAQPTVPCFGSAVWLPASIGRHWRLWDGLQHGVLGPMHRHVGNNVPVVVAVGDRRAAGTLPWIKVRGGAVHNTSSLFRALDMDGSGVLNGPEVVALKPLLRDAAAALGVAACPKVPPRLQGVGDLEALIAVVNGVDVVAANHPELTYMCLDADTTLVSKIQGPVCAPIAVDAVQRVALIVIPFVAAPHCVWKSNDGSSTVPLIWVCVYAASIVAFLAGPVALRFKWLQRIALEIIAEETEAALQDSECYQQGYVVPDISMRKLSTVAPVVCSCALLHRVMYQAAGFLKLETLSNCSYNFLSPSGDGERRRQRMLAFVGSAFISRS